MLELLKVDEPQSFAFRLLQRLFDGDEGDERDGLLALEEAVGAVPQVPRVADDADEGSGEALGGDVELRRGTARGVLCGERSGQLLFAEAAHSPD